MALLFMDSFDHYATADLAEKYTSGTGTIAVGRYGNGIVNPELLLGLPTISSPIAVQAVAGKLTGFGGGDIFQLGETTSSEFIKLDVMNDGSLRVHTMDSGLPVLGLSAAGLVHTAVWHHFAWEVGLAAGATGYVKVWLDGALVINVTNKQTYPTTMLVSGAMATTYGWTSCTLGDGIGGTFDDYVVLDGAGAAPYNTTLGDKRIGVIRPNGVGDLTQWTPSPAVPNWQNVDETSPDDDTSYNAAGSAGLKDLYHFEDVSTGNTIVGFQVLLSAKRSAEGFAAVRPIYKHAGAVVNGTTRDLAATYFYRNREVFVKMPGGVDAITDAHMNALQMGPERTS